MARRSDSQPLSAGPSSAPLFPGLSTNDNGELMLDLDLDFDMDEEAGSSAATTTTARATAVTAAAATTTAMASISDGRAGPARTSSRPATARDAGREATNTSGKREGALSAAEDDADDGIDMSFEALFPGCPRHVPSHRDQEWLYSIDELAVSPTQRISRWSRDQHLLNRPTLATAPRVQVLSVYEEAAMKGKACVFIDRISARLKLPETMAYQAKVLVHRFYARQPLQFHPFYEVAAGLVFVVLKLGEIPGARGVKNLLSAASSIAAKQHVPENSAEWVRWRSAVLFYESYGLAVIGFDTSVALPHHPLLVMLAWWYPRAAAAFADPPTARIEDVDVAERAAYLTLLRHAASYAAQALHTTLPLRCHAFEMAGAALWCAMITVDLGLRLGTCDVGTAPSDGGATANDPEVWRWPAPACAASAVWRGTRLRNFLESWDLDPAWLPVWAEEIMVSRHDAAYRRFLEHLFTPSNDESEHPPREIASAVSATE